MLPLPAFAPLTLVPMLVPVRRADARMDLDSFQTAMFSSPVLVCKPPTSRL